MRHLVLVGPMGSGKSTVGRLAADRLALGFVDTDELVVETAGRSVAEVFEAEGESGFRAREREAVLRTCDREEPTVISCGGGAVEDERSRRAIAAAGVVVWLDAPGVVLAGRVGDGGSRPLLAGKDAAGELDLLRDRRADAYAGVADRRVDTEGRSAEDVTSAVVAAYEAAS